MAINQDVSGSDNDARGKVKMNSHKIVPWLVIILLLFFFFPIGIVLMIIKLHKDSENFITNGNGTAIVGWVFLGLGVIYFFMGLGVKDTDSNYITMLAVGVIFCVGGFALVHHGNKYKNIGLKFARYFPCIANSKDGSLYRIASSSGISYDTVHGDIQSMINLGLLPESYIDNISKCLVSPLIKKDSYMGPLTYTEKPKKNLEKVVKCPNCGGVNTITDEGSVCEFCGSPLEC